MPDIREAPLSVLEAALKVDERMLWATHAQIRDEIERRVVLLPPTGGTIGQMPPGSDVRVSSWALYHDATGTSWLNGQYRIDATMPVLLEYTIHVRRDAGGWHVDASGLRFPVWGEDSYDPSEVADPVPIATFIA